MHYQPDRTADGHFMPFYICPFVKLQSYIVDLDGVASVESSSMQNSSSIHRFTGRVTFNKAKSIKLRDF